MHFYLIYAVHGELFVFCDGVLVGFRLAYGFPPTVPLGFRVFTKRCVSLL